MRESFEMCVYLWQFDRPGVTWYDPCSWREVNCELLTGPPHPSYPLPPTHTLIPSLLDRGLFLTPPPPTHTLITSRLDGGLFLPPPPPQTQTLIPSWLDGGLLHPFGVIPDGEHHGDCRWRRSWPLWIWRLSCCGESECGCFLSLATLGSVIWIAKTELSL